MVMRRYGHIRLLNFPENNPAATKKDFQSGAGEKGHRFSDSGIQHAAYAVDDAAAFFENVHSQGVKFLFEPMRVLGDSVISYFHDPEGNTIEIIEREASAAKMSRLLGEFKMGEMAVRSRLRRLLKSK